MKTLKAVPNISIDGEDLYELAIETLGSTGEKSARNTADHYENSVESLFGRIGKSVSGGAVLRAVAVRTGQTMTVLPFINLWASNAPQARADADNKKHAKQKRRGSSSTIRYSPGNWVADRLTLQNFHPGYSGPGTDPDEVLLHEVFHGLRAMQGLTMLRNVPFQRKYDSFDEFFAILVTNIFRSELKRPKLRADHSDFQSLQSHGFTNVHEWMDYRLNRSHLRKLRRQMPNLWRDLKGVKAEFNPIGLL